MLNLMPRLGGMNEYLYIFNNDDDGEVRSEGNSLMQIAYQISTKPKGYIEIFSQIKRISTKRVRDFHEVFCPSVRSSKTGIRPMHREKVEHQGKLDRAYNSTEDERNVEDSEEDIVWAVVGRGGARNLPTEGLELQTGGLK